MFEEFIQLPWGNQLVISEGTGSGQHPVASWYLVISPVITGWRFLRQVSYRFGTPEPTLEVFEQQLLEASRWDLVGGEVGAAGAPPAVANGTT